MHAVTFYDVGVWAHVVSVFIAFGVTFAYPLIVPFFVNQAPKAAPAWFEVMGRLGKLVITPFATLALIFGAILATDRDLWGEVWVNVPLVILVLLLGLGGAFFAPNERKLVEIAKRDVAAAGDGEVQWSQEFQDLGRKLGTAGAISSLLVVVAAYFMIAKPFA